MKNIHILPTNNPSRLYYNSQNKTYQLCEFPKYHTDIKSTHNIYITSDEEIKSKDWVFRITDNTVFKNNHNYYNHNIKEHHISLYRKIILTTNFQLITNGVQAIDDEFLEWFVNNSNCEEVEINYDSFEKTGNISIWEYEIIIPKEGSKQENCCTPIGQIKRYKECIGCDRKPKQETTLEEVAETFGKVYYGEYTDITSLMTYAFISGAKWQQERSYTD